MGVFLCEVARLGFTGRYENAVLVRLGALLYDAFDNVGNG